MAILSMEELLETCISELPMDQIPLENGGEVKISAMKGSDTSRIFSNENMDEKIYQTLTLGLIEPPLRGKKLQKFIDFNPTDSITIFSGIMKLSNALGEIEEKAVEKAKKS